MLKQLIKRKALQEEPWPPHSIICDCSKCERSAKQYIKKVMAKSR
jgi:hypothetical protein